MKALLFSLLFPCILFAQTETATALPPVEEIVHDLTDLHLQDASLEDQSEAAPPLSMKEELATLSALNDSIEIREQQRANIYTRMKNAEDPVEREKMLPELQKVNSQLSELYKDFQKIAVKTDFSDFEKEAPKEFNWQTELGQLLEPFMKEMKAATKDSREMGELQDKLEEATTKKKTSLEALESLKPLLAAEQNPQVKQRLIGLNDLWNDRLRTAENNITTSEYQINLRQKDKESPLEQAKGMASGFVRTRGLNLLFGMLAFGGIFLVMNGIQSLWSKYRPSRKKGRSFSARLSSLIWKILTLIIAIGAMLATFNATGDWFLVSLTILFLLGVGWAGMKTLPGMVELFRMMLNMGAVREDERLIYEGLPWKVNSISFRTELLNPLLNGGVLTLPTRMLVGLVSRPEGDDEEWFPTKKDDWVQLSDGVFGKVAYQCPSNVQIVTPGGSQKVYKTIQYMELAPMTLSTGFRKEVVFGIDYSHVNDAVTFIPKTMKEHLKGVLSQKLGDNLNHLDVFLENASESAIQFCVIVDCKGEAASQWPYLSMWVQTALVALCNEQGWKIPFPQLQLHTDK
ncbi:hypothetical protein P3T73_09185 [Kiritimatiellota bacterium B12222]|nr:hypothetical protein P3T73_09185 [Kiritimatiellota bacterium B12222]